MCFSIFECAYYKFYLVPKNYYIKFVFHQQPPMEFQTTMLEISYCPDNIKRLSWEKGNKEGYTEKGVQKLV